MATVRASEKKSIDLSQDRMQDLLQPRLGEQLVNTPADDAEFQQSKGLWKDFLSTVKNSPEAQQFLITAGLTMASGAGMNKGDDFADNLRNSVQAGMQAVGTYGQLQEAARQRAFEEDQTAQNNFSARLLQGAQADLALRQMPGYGDMYGSGSGDQANEAYRWAYEQSLAAAKNAYPDDPVKQQEHIQQNFPKLYKGVVEKQAVGAFAPVGEVPMQDEDGNDVQVDYFDAFLGDVVGAYEVEGNEMAVAKAKQKYGTALTPELDTLAQEVARLRREGKAADAQKKEAELRQRLMANDAQDTASILLNMESSAATAAGIPTGQFGFQTGEAGTKWQEEYKAQYEVFEQTEQFKLLPDSEKKKLKAKYDKLKGK